MRFLIDWDKDGHALVDPDPPFDGAINLVPSIIAYSNSGNTVTLSHNGASPYGGVTLTASELQGADKVTISPPEAANSLRWPISSGVAAFYTISIRYVNRGASTNGIKFTTYQVRESGLPTGTIETDEFTNRSTDTYYTVKIVVTTSINAEYLQIDIEEADASTNDTGNWEFDSFAYYAGNKPVASGQYTGSAIDQIEDVTPYVLDADWNLGDTNPYNFVLNSGACRIVLDNRDYIFLNEGTNGVLPPETELVNAIVIIQYYKDAWKYLWSGFIKDIKYNFTSKSLPTVEIEGTQGMEFTQEILVPLNSYENTVGGDGTNTTGRDYITDLVDTTHFLSPNIANLSRDLYSEVGQIFSTSNSYSTTTNNMALKTGWRTHGIPLYDMLLFLAIEQKGYIYIDEFGFIRLKTRPATGGTTVSLDPSTDVINYVYEIGKDFYGGITVESGSEFNTSANSIEGVSVTSILSTPTTKTEAVPEDEYNTFFWYGTVTSSSGSVDIDSANIEDYIVQRPSMAVPQMILEGPGSRIPYAAGKDWRITLTQTKPDEIEILYEELNSGSPDFFPSDIGVGSGSAEMRTREFPSGGAAKSLPILDLDMTALEFAHKKPDIYGDILDEIQDEVSLMSTITFRPRSSAFITDMIDLLPQSNKIPVMTFENIFPGGPTGKRHHVLGMKGSFSPKDSITTSYSLYRSQQSYRDRIVSDLSPLVYFPMNEGTGTTMEDISGNNYDGTYTSIDWNGATTPFGDECPTFTGLGDYASHYTSGLASGINFEEGAFVLFLRLSDLTKLSPNRYAMSTYRDTSNRFYVYIFSSQFRIANQCGSTTFQIDVDPADYSVNRQTDWFGIGMSWSRSRREVNHVINGLIRPFDVTTFAAETGSGLTSTHTHLATQQTSDANKFVGELGEFMIFNSYVEPKDMALLTLYYES